MLLHWLLAGLLLGMILVGLLMGALPRGDASKALLLNLHLTTGLLVLLLVAVRIYARRVSAVPVLPEHYPLWRVRLARSVHALFYLLMIALPVLGLSVWAVDPFVGGPALFGEGVAVSNAAARLHTAHYLGAWMLLALMLLHVMGAMGGDGQGRLVLHRMIPAIKK